MPEGRYRVLFQKSAFREYEARPESVTSRVDQVLEILSINPLSGILRFRKLKGKDNQYPVRVGDYRIIYSPQQDVLIVGVIRIGHRKDVYRYF